MDSRESTGPARWVLFSKHVRKLPFGEILDGVKAAGLEGLDLTVRPGGHAEPEQVETVLPELIEQARRHGLDVPMITTEIVSASAPLTRRILTTAAAAGVKYYKMGYFRYRGFGTLSEGLETARRAFGELAALNAELGISGGYHNHSADFFGAALWDIHRALKDIPPHLLGVYFDPCHAAIEGGSSGWEMGMDLLSDKIVMLAVKDFRWRDDKNGYAGGRRHSVEYGPLENGDTPWNQVVARLTKIAFDGPISFHSEYQGTHSFADLSDREVLRQTASDVAFFKKLLTNDKPIER